MEWEWIGKDFRNNRLDIDSIYTIVKDMNELEEIKNWINITLSAPKIIHIKYEKEEFKYITLVKNNDNTISKKRNVIFMRNHPFFCPFIYKTFFVDVGGSISYCVKKLVNKEQKFYTGWSKKLFTANCDKPESCIYSIYCNKICPYLSSIYNNEDEDECSLGPQFDRLVTNKIKSMV